MNRFATPKIGKSASKFSRFIMGAATLLLVDGAVLAGPPPARTNAKPVEVKKPHRNPADLSEKDELRADRLLFVADLLIKAKKERIKNPAKLSESIFSLRNPEAGRDERIRTMAFLSDYEWRERKLDAGFRERIAYNIMPFLKDSSDESRFIAFSTLTKFDWNGIRPEIIKNVVERSVDVMRNDRVFALMKELGQVLGNIGEPAFPAVFDEMKRCKAGSRHHINLISVLASFDWDKMPASRHAEAANMMLMKLKEQKPPGNAKAFIGPGVVMDCMMLKYLNWQSIPQNVAKETIDTLMPEIRHGIAFPYKSDVIRLSVAGVLLRMGDAGVASMLIMLNSENPSIFYSMLSLLANFDDSKGIKLSERNRDVLAYALRRFENYNSAGIDSEEIRRKAADAVRRLSAKKAIPKQANR